MIQDNLRDWGIVAGFLGIAALGFWLSGDRQWSAQLLIGVAALVGHILAFYLGVTHGGAYLRSADD